MTLISMDSIGLELFIPKLFDVDTTLRDELVAD
jgi:hypothetical protein